MERLTAQEVIDLLGLEPVPGEGGHYRQTLKVPNSDPALAHAPVNTAIYFLVTPESWSGLHALEADELFNFHMGDECRMVVCSPTGVLEERRLGTDLRAGNQGQALVPAGMWQGTGTMLAGHGDYGYALLGTTMTPGFRADQFTMGTEADLETLPDLVATALRPFLSPELP